MQQQQIIVIINSKISQTIVAAAKTNSNMQS